MTIILDFFLSTVWSGESSAELKVGREVVKKLDYQLYQLSLVSRSIGRVVQG
jgi:hypothetical protein